MKSKDYYTGKRYEMLEFIPRNASKILEVGCGCGEFGKIVKEKFDISEYWGIDIDAYSIREASKVLDKAFIHDFNRKSAKIPMKYFDCIIFNDALEHLYDPWQVLKYCKSILIDNGNIVCSLPNVRHITNLLNLIFKKDWEYVNAGTLDNTHYRFFTEKSIVEMFKNSGFKVLTIKGINRKRSAKPRMYLFIFILNILSFLFYKKNKTKISKFHLDVKYLQFAIKAQIDNK